MFYAHFVLAKKGPLARIWLAAHWDKKLTKAHVFETNIEKSVDGILQPKVKMALRTSGHLLLGVVRIYSRKAKYLLADCNEAFVKIKMAFRPGMVDLPEESREAAVNAITLPEVFHDFDTAMPELNDVDIEQQFTLNQSRAEEITLREDYGTMALSTMDDGFGDMGFGSTSPDMMRGGLDVPTIDHQGGFFGEDGLEAQMNRMSDTVDIPVSRSPVHELAPAATELEERIKDLGAEVMAGGLFEGELFDEPVMNDIPPMEKATSIQEDVVKRADTALGAESEEEFDRFDGPPSPDRGMSDNESRAASAIPPVHKEAPIDEPLADLMPAPASMEAPVAAEEEKQPEAIPEQTLLLQNEEESFALAPVDATAIKGYVKTKRKRKLIVDEVKNISGEEMKNQLSDTSDIVTTLDLAPPTRRLMHWKETGGVEKLFALPARPIPSRVLFAIYQRHLTSRQIGVEDFGMLGTDLGIEQVRDAPAQNQNVSAVSAEEDTTTIAKRLTRKRKHQSYEETPMSPQPVPVAQVVPAEPVLNETTPMETSVVSAPEVTPVEPAAIVADLSELDEPPRKIAAISAMDASESSPAPAHTVSVDQVRAEIEKPATPSNISEFNDTLMPPPSEGMSTLSIPENVDYPQAPETPIGAGTSSLMVPRIPSMSESSLNFPQIPSIPPPAGSTPFAHSMDPTSIPHLSADQVQQVLEGTYQQNDSQHHANEEFALPASPGEFNEEQQTDETDEQFEERILNKRAAQLFYLVKNRFNRTDAPFKFSEMSHRNNKKQAAQKFYSCLVLKKLQVLELEQDEPYADLYLSKGPKYDNPLI